MSPALSQSFYPSPVKTTLTGGSGDDTCQLLRSGLPSDAPFPPQAGGVCPPQVSPALLSHLPWEAASLQWLPPPRQTALSGAALAGHEGVPEDLLWGERRLKPKWESPQQGGDQCLLTDMNTCAWGVSFQVVQTPCQNSRTNRV